MDLTHPGVPVYVDVSVSEVVRGVFEIEGTLYYADGTVTFEYHTKQMGSRRSEAETFHVHLDDVREIELKRGMPGPSILLHTRRLVTFEYVSGAGRNQLAFKVKHRHRKQAAAFAAQLRRALAESGDEGISSIPFQLPEANFGLTEIEGLLYLDDAFLVFEVGVGLPGGSKTRQQLIKVEATALEEVRLDRGLLRDRLRVRPKTDELLTAMPGKYEAALVLKIPKKYRAAAEQLVEEVRQLLLRA